MIRNHSKEHHFPYRVMASLFFSEVFSPFKNTLEHASINRTIHHEADRPCKQTPSKSFLSIVTNCELVSIEWL